MDQSYYREKLRNCESIGDIFELGREIIYKVLKMRRAGLSLYLQDLNQYVLAYHIMGSNTIVVNKAVLDAILTLKRDREVINSYIFVVITHEYLHSLGIYDEMLLRKFQYEICNKAFGYDHPTSEMIEKGIFEVFPELKEMKIRIRSREVKVVRDFDKSSTTYIS